MKLTPKDLCCVLKTARNLEEFNVLFGYAGYSDVTEKLNFLKENFREFKLLDTFTVSGEEEEDETQSEYDSFASLIIHMNGGMFKFTLPNMQSAF